MIIIIIINRNPRKKARKKEKKSCSMIYDVSILQGLFMLIRCLVLPIQTKVKM